MLFFKVHTKNTVYNMKQTHGNVSSLKIGPLSSLTSLHNLPKCESVGQPVPAIH